MHGAIFLIGMRTIAKTSIALVVLLAALPACRRKKAEDPQGSAESALVEDGADTNDAEKDTENLVATIAPDPATWTPTSGGEAAARTYLPRGCVVHEHDAATKTITLRFSSCIGPRGLFEVTGVVRATYATPSAGVLILDIVGDDLTVNGAKADWSAHAEIAASGAMRTMTWRGQLAGTTRRGREFTRTNEKTISWTVGTPCIQFEGTSEGDVSGRRLRTEITDLGVCRSACPDAGGKIVVTNLDTNLRIEIQFDGTNRATYIGPNGRPVRFPLLCRA